MKKAERLREIRMQLDEGEEKRFSPWACLSRHVLRRKEEDKILIGHRQNF